MKKDERKFRRRYSFHRISRNDEKVRSLFCEDALEFLKDDQILELYTNDFHTTTVLAKYAIRFVRGGYVI